MTGTGRLFWKFFFVFWSAQVLTAVCVGLLIWGLHQADGPQTVGGKPDRRVLPAPSMGGAGAEFPSHAAPPFPPPPSRGRAVSLPVIPIAAGTFVSMLFAASMAVQFSRPIRKLRAAFDGLASGRLDTRIVSEKGWLREELEELGRDFNDMAERLQRMVVAQKRLLHDVSHELRSPLARLQAAADLLNQQPERGEEFRHRILRETERMDVLVGEILTLARLDADAEHQKQSYERIALHELARETLEAVRLSPDARQCELRNSVEPTGWIDGRANELLRALENVVTNAIKHSPPRGIVELKSYRDGSSWVISCTDEGPGVLEEDRARIFEPFFRSAHSQHKEGYGLGLPIAKRIIESHGGSVSAANRSERGLAVRMIMPAAD